MRNSLCQILRVGIQWRSCQILPRQLTDNVIFRFEMSDKFLFNKFLILIKISNLKSKSIWANLKFHNLHIYIVHTKYLIHPNITTYSTLHLIPLLFPYLQMTEDYHQNITNLNFTHNGFRLDHLQLRFHLPSSTQQISQGLRWMAHIPWFEEDFSLFDIFSSHPKC